MAFAEVDIRSYVSEPDRGRRKWKGKAAAVHLVRLERQQPDFPCTRQPNRKENALAVRQEIRPPVGCLAAIGIQRCQRFGYAAAG